MPRVLRAGDVGADVRALQDVLNFQIRLGIFAKGDFKGTVDYTSERATSTPLFQMQGAFTLGFDGRV
jgi:hypothetical protein